MLRRSLSRVRRHILKSIFSYNLSRQTLTVPSGEAKLSYGREIGALLESKADVTGGKVKLTYLQAVYPHDNSRFNILYLVSSALPLNAVEVVRWAKNRGAGVVLNQNGVAYQAWTDDYQAINNELSEVISQTDVVLYQSKFCKLAADRFVCKAPKKWEILNNCVDVDRFRPVCRCHNDTMRLLVAGTHYQRERVVVPLYTLRALLDQGLRATLQVAGRLSWSGANQEIHQLIEKLALGSAVNLSGPYTQAEAPTLFGRNDILVHLKYKDPCPNVVIEAMACGLPVIASNSGGLPELLDRRGGILLPVDDSWTEMFYPKMGVVKEAIISLFNDLTRQQNLVRQHAVENFSTEKWIHKHKSLFQNHLSEVIQLPDDLSTDSVS